MKWYMRLLFRLFWVPMFLYRMAKYGDLVGHLKGAKSWGEWWGILVEFEHDAAVEIGKRLGGKV